MKAVCQCGYECIAKTREDLAAMVAADGGNVEYVMVGVYDLACPACDEELEMNQ